jgi:hypothetical protein
MAAAKIAFRRVQDGTFATDQTQRLAQQTTQQVNAIPFSQGVWVRNVVIGTSNTTINHGLGRVPRGYIVTRIQNNAVAFCESLPANQPSDQKRQYAFIASGAPVTVDIWFF